MDYKDFEEKKCGERLIYDGRIVHLWCDDVILPNGKKSLREVARHNGAVAVVPITDDGKIICVRQFRYPFLAVLLEIPAGKLDGKGENHESAARRELREETGAECRELIELGPLYPSVAVSDEIIYMYAATGLTFGACCPDEDEFLETVKIPLGKLVEMIMAGEVPDAKTQTAVLKVKTLIDEGKIKY